MIFFKYYFFRQKKEHLRQNLIQVPEKALKQEKGEAKENHQGKAQSRILTLYEDYKLYFMSDNMIIILYNMQTCRILV